MGYSPLSWGVPIGLVFLWLALRDADLEAVRRSLQAADAGLIALAIAAFGVVYAFQSARWRKIASTPGSQRGGRFRS